MRIYIVGPAWSGKSTLAQRLGAHCRIPVIHLDELMWKEWMVENKDYRTVQDHAITGNDWIIEGSSVSILKSMKDRVDTVVLLNPPPMGNVVRIVTRYLKGLFWGWKRVGWAMENTNELRFRFLLNTATWRTRQLPRIRVNIAECSLESKTIEIHSLEDVFERVCVQLLRDTV